MSRLPIPPEVLTQHVIALGKTRSGKSSKMRLLVEWLLDHEKPVCMIDPKGDWWGIKSSADGKRAGYAVVIFGGEHADVALNPNAGAAVAELVATGNRPALIDLGGWMVGERTRFFVDFAAAFFKQTRGARFLVIDEVHNFAPQGRIMDPDAGKMLHWANRLASEGSGKGITVLAASQRPQKVHKDFVTSMETLIACKVIHKLDRDAIKDWIDGCADPAKGKEVLQQLAGMQKPEAWVWSPEIDFGPERITWPMFNTYDSFKPRAADVGKLKGWAEVDLEDVRGKLSAAIEEAKANDPRVLRARIAELERQAAKGVPAAPAKGASREELKAAEAAGYYRGLNDGERYKLKDREAEHKELRGALHRAIETALNEHAPQQYKPTPIPVNRAAALIHAGNTAGQPQGAIAAAPARVTVTHRARGPEAAANGAGQKMGKAERKFLTVLAQRQGKRTTRNQVAIFAGYSSTSGHVDNTLGALRSAGLAEGGGEDVRITEAGLAALGDFDPLPTGEDLRRYWLEHAGGKAERAMLEVILKAYPATLTRDEVAEAASYNVTSGHVDNTLGRLRSMDLIQGPGSAIRASEELFE